jgi:hypothetical protein
MRPTKLATARNELVSLRCRADGLPYFASLAAYGKRGSEFAVIEGC